MKKILLLIGLTLFVFDIVFIAFNVGKQKFIFENIAPEATVSAFATESNAFDAKHGGSFQSVNDKDEMSWWYGTVTNESPNWIQLEWNEPKNIDRIKIIFAQSRFAEDYKIQFWQNGAWVDAVEEKNNPSDLKLYDFPRDHRIVTSKIRLAITKTHDRDNLQRLSEWMVYEQKPAGFLKLLLTYTIAPIADLAGRLGVALGLLLVLFIPGFTVLSHRKFAFFDKDERFALSFGATISILFLASVFFWATKSPVPFYAVFCLFGFSLVVFFKNRVYADITAHAKTVSFLVIFSLLFYTLYLYLIDATFGYQYTNDYIWQYGVAKIVMNQASLFSTHLDFILSHHQIGLRTIMLAMVSIPFLRTLGDHFIIYQTLSSISVVLMYPAMALLFRKFFDGKTALLASLFLLVTPFYTFMALLCQTRWFICYFIFLYIYFLMHDSLTPKIKYRLAGVLAGLAFMTHPVSVPFIVGGLVYIFFKASGQNRLRSVGAVMKPFVFIVLPWFFWCWITRQEGTYYLAFLHIRPDWSTSAPGAVKNFMKIPIHEIVQNKLWNIAGLFLYNVRFQPVQLTFDYVRNLNQFTFTGTVTLPLLIFAIMAIALNFRRRFVEILSFVGIPFICFVFFLTMYAGGGGIDLLVPLIPILMATGIALMRRWRLFLWLGFSFLYCLLNHFIVIWLVGFVDMYRWTSDFKSNIDIFMSFLNGNVYSVLSFTGLLFWYTVLIAMFFRWLPEKRSASHD